MLNVVRRYRDLTGFDNREIPLAVYQDTDGSIRTIVSNEIDTFMRTLATQRYNLDPVKDSDEIKRWSSHSLRVGACQILYAKGFSTHEIKKLLRWKSNAFMDYLRDIAWVARKRNDAMADLDSDEVETFL